MLNLSFLKGKIVEGYIPDGLNSILITYNLMQFQAGSNIRYKNSHNSGY